ncbi:MAG: hypothetical protein IKZ59_00650 [Clostridia bacterium]|nr:hypothetical protein [Clostridia bacterium]
MKKAVLILLAFCVCLAFVGCEPEVVKRPVKIIDETKDYVDEAESDPDDFVPPDGTSSHTPDSSDTTDTSSDASGDNSSTDTPEKTEVDLKDPTVIIGKWKAETRLVNGKEGTFETKYLVITEDFKFYPTNDYVAYTGNLTYHYEEGKITVMLGDKIDEEYVVSMDNEDTLTLSYTKSGNTIEDTYSKITE